jgi:hypothetical protein
MHTRYELLPSTYGRITGMLRGLYEDLHAAGYAHVDLVEMTLREAMLRHFGSPEVIDATFGEGIYKGIKSETGVSANWRKPWSRVIEEQKAMQPIRGAHLAALREQAAACLQSGLSEQEILVSLQAFLGAEGMRQAA